MKYRNLALCALALVLVGVFFLLKRSLDPEISEIETVEHPANQFLDEEPLAEAGPVDESPDKAPINALLQEPIVPTPKGSYGNAIPFESVAMSELEEVDLTNSGEVHSHKIREWRGRLEPSLTDIKDLLESEGEDGVLAISLPDATQVNVTRMRYQSFGSNQGVLSGKILGDPFGEVVLSYVNQAVAGSIRDYRNDQVWEIRNAGEGRQYIAQVDVEALGVCGLCSVHGGVK